MTRDDTVFRLSKEKFSLSLPLWYTDTTYLSLDSPRIKADKTLKVFPQQAATSATKPPIEDPYEPYDLLTSMYQLLPWQFSPLSQ